MAKDSKRIDRQELIDDCIIKVEEIAEVLAKASTETKDGEMIHMAAALKGLAVILNAGRTAEIQPHIYNVVYSIGIGIDNATALERIKTVADA